LGGANFSAQGSNGNGRNGTAKSHAAFPVHPMQQVLCKRSSCACMSRCYCTLWQQGLVSLVAASLSLTMVGAAAGRVHPPPRDAVHQQLVGHCKVEHLIDGLSLLGKHFVQLLSLRLQSGGQRR
jgi:hypothetical protein